MSLRISHELVALYTDGGYTFATGAVRVSGSGGRRGETPAEVMRQARRIHADLEGDHPGVQVDIVEVLCDEAGRRLGAAKIGQWPAAGRMMQADFPALRVRQP